MKHRTAPASPVGPAAAGRSMQLIVQLACALCVWGAAGLAGDLLLRGQLLYGQAPDAASSQVGSIAAEPRTAWLNSKLQGFPEPPPPLRLVEAYPQLEIPKLIALGAVPDSDWLLAIDHENAYAGGGRAVGFLDRADATQTELFLEIPEIIYGLAWHPRFNANRWVYVGCNGPSELLGAAATKVLRFKVEGQGPYHCDPASRTLIIEWPSDGHNGGDLTFGNDGMLYVSAGDGTSDSDTDRNGQNLSTLAGSVLRIDVATSPLDAHDGSPAATGSAPAAYRIPSDNPFVGHPSARGEIWAYGLRNPWRISFDRQSNQLWVGNNGQDLWESAYLVERGANYGWSINESNHPFHTQQDHGPAAISPATVEHPHSEARSLTGGHIYRGAQFPELHGAYIYGDYSTGNIWAVRHDGQRVVEHTLVARSRIQITDFGFDSRGEMLIADHAGGIYRFAANPAVTDGGAFPRKLSQTGLFRDTPGQEPETGVIPYSVNSPLWSDGAIKKRWLAVPGDLTVGFTARGSWDFPEGTVLVKSFAFPTASGGAELNRLVETRLLAKQQGEWYGYSYRWNADQSDAELVEPSGRAESLDWVVENAVPVNTTWRYPSRSECMVCHSRAAKFVLGLSTEQMHRPHPYSAADGETRFRSQLETLASLGLFGASWENPDLAQLPQLADPYDETQDVDRRARSYLHTNCSNCHVGAGGGNSKIVLDYFTPREKMNLFDADPLHHHFDVPSAKLVLPGKPEQSILFHRINRRGTGQMPPLATDRIDLRAVELMRQWIAD